MSDILAIMLMEEETGKPLYSYFVDAELKKNPSVIRQRMRSREIKMIHELGTRGMNLVFSALVKEEPPNLRSMLKTFKERVEKTYPESLRAGTGNFADFLILDNIIKDIFNV